MSLLRSHVLLLSTLLPSCASAGSQGDGHEVRGSVVRPLPGHAPSISHGTSARAAPGTSSSALVMHGDDGGLWPQLLLVPAGQTVRFVNEDTIFHRFFSSSDRQAFDTGLLGPGASSGFQLDHPGVVHVYCSLHSDKKGTILVLFTDREGRALELRADDARAPDPE